MDLHPDEIIIKEILPRKSFFFNLTEKLRMVFSFFYLAISSFLLVSVFETGFSAFSLVGTGIFCNALYIAFFRWIVKYFNLKKTCYVITDRRIIIAGKESRSVFKFKNLQDIKQINAEMNNKFFGNIIFGEPEHIFGRNDEPFSLLKNRGVNFNENQYAFVSVEHINEIIPVFEDLGFKVNKTFY